MRRKVFYFFKAIVIVIIVFGLKTNAKKYFFSISFTKRLEFNTVLDLIFGSIFCDVL
jgi:hypothetical protein